MLEKVNQYLQGLYERIAFYRKKARQSAYTCAIKISNDTVLIACSKKGSHNSTELLWCDSFNYIKIDDITTSLAEIVKKYNIEHSNCILVLSSDHYQLLQMEALPVSASEFQAAIRWKIKDLISFSIEDAIIDSFPVPLQHGHDPHQMITVIVSRLSYLSPIVKIIKECDLYLSKIDINELSLKNITAKYEDDEKTSAIIYLSNHASQLIITRQKTLYFSRSFDFRLGDMDSLSEDDINQNIDKLGLEIQRSFDYYQSQWRHPIPARVFISSKNKSIQIIVDYLVKHLTLPIQILNLNDVIVNKQNISPDVQGKFLSIIGALLRDDVNDSTRR